MACILFAFLAPTADGGSNPQPIAREHLVGIPLSAEQETRALDPADTRFRPCHRRQHDQNHRQRATRTTSLEYEPRTIR